MDLIIRERDGRVEAIGSRIAMVNGLYAFRNPGESSPMIPVATFVEATRIVNDVFEPLPDDFLPACNYQFVDGGFVPNGASPPERPPRDPESVWADCDPLSAFHFAALLAFAIGAEASNRLRADEGWQAFAAGPVDPNEHTAGHERNVFHSQITDWLKRRRITPTEVKKVRQMWPAFQCGIGKLVAPIWAF